MSRKFEGLLTKQEDDNLWEQALLGVASATTVKPFVPPDQAGSCTKLFNSYLTLTNYPLTEAGGTTLRSVDADGANMNPGPGPQPELATFLAVVDNHHAQTTRKES